MESVADDRLRGAIYDFVREHGAPPSVGELAARLTLSREAIGDGLERLSAARVVILQPESGEILMAPPFSAVPTPFRVTTSRHAAYANCIWDAFGVPVMLRTTAVISTACACCGESMTLDADGRTAPAANGIVHFAVPARHWWDDLVFT